MIVVPWTGFVYVCNSCDRKAEWPFCKHRENNGEWFRSVSVREVSRRVPAASKPVSPC